MKPKVLDIGQELTFTVAYPYIAAKGDRVIYEGTGLVEKEDKICLVFKSTRNEARFFVVIGEDYELIAARLNGWFGTDFDFIQLSNEPVIAIE